MASWAGGGREAPKSVHIPNHEGWCERQESRFRTDGDALALNIPFLFSFVYSNIWCLAKCSSGQPQILHVSIEYFYEVGTV